MEELRVSHEVSPVSDQKDNNFWIIQKSYRLITMIHLLYLLLTLLPDCLSIGLLLLYQSLACTNHNGDHIYLHQSGTRWRP